MRIGDIDERKAVVQRPEVVDGLASMHHNDQGTFSSQEVDQELEKGVDRKGLKKLVSDASNRNYFIPHIYRELDPPTLQPSAT